MKLFKTAAAILIAAGSVFGLTGTSQAATEAVPTGPYGSGYGSAPTQLVLSTVDYTNRSQVLIVGDSITVRGYKQLAYGLPGIRLAVNAQSSRNTTQSIDSLIAQINKGMKLPRVLVMAVGSNDVVNPPVMAAQIQRLIKLVPSTTKIVWVTVQVSRIKYPVSTQIADQRNSMWVNTQIVGGMAGHGQVCDWAYWFQSNPNRLRLYLGVDGVHPTIDIGTIFWGKGVIANCVKVALKN